MTRSPAIEAEGLVKHFGDTVAVDGVSFVVPEGSVLGLLGPNGAGKTTTVRMMTTLTVAHGRHRPRGRPRHPHRPGRRAAQHGPHRSGGDGRRAPDRPGEPPPHREPLRPRRGLHQAGQRRAARAVLAVRRRRPHRQDLLRRHAPAARPRGQPDRHAAGAVPRRADHRPRPALAGGAVGGAARAGRRRHDPAADDAIPRGGRPAGRQHRGDRPGHRDRRGHAARSSRTSRVRRRSS